MRASVFEGECVFTLRVEQVFPVAVRQRKLEGIRLHRPERVEEIVGPQVHDQHSERTPRVRVMDRQCRTQYRGVGRLDGTELAIEFDGAEIDLARR